MKKKVQDAWIKLSLLICVLHLRKILLVVFHLHRREPDMESPFGRIGGCELDEDNYENKDMAQIHYYATQIMSHQGSFPGFMCLSGDRSGCDRAAFSWGSRGKICWVDWQ